MTLTTRLRNYFLALFAANLLWTSTVQAQFIPQTTHDPDAESRKRARSAIGKPTRSGGGGIRTTPRGGSTPPARRPASTGGSSTRRPIVPPVVIRPTIKPQVRPPQPIKIGLMHSVSEFAPHIVAKYKRAKKSESYYADRLQRIRRAFADAKRRRDTKTMNKLREDYAKAKKSHERYQSYRTRAGKYLNQKFPIHFTGSALSKRHAFYNKLRQKVASDTKWAGKPFSIYYQQGKLKVIWFPGGRVNYGGVDVTNEFPL